jgi:hypothetical protein
MIAARSRLGVGLAQRQSSVSLARMLWVAPLTLMVALAVAFAIRFIAQSLDPRLARMPQLGQPMVMLVVEGVLAAVVVFVLFALVVARPFFWYRVVGVVALMFSLLPDLGLALGGSWMGMAMRFVGPLTSIGVSGPAAGGPPPGGGPAAGGPPPGFLNSMPLEQVLVLMSLHVAVAVVCIVGLTTLTRRRPAV